MNNKTHQELKTQLTKENPIFQFNFPENMKNFLIALPLILCLPLVADEKPETKAPNDKKEEPKKGKTHKVTRDTFKLEFELDGTFMNPNAREVSIETKSWGLLNVLDALPQGASVKKGQSLVTLDFEKIDEKIRDLRFEQELTSLDLQYNGLDEAAKTLIRDACAAKEGMSLQL